MGMDLVNERGSGLHFSPSGWALALNLAEAYGWVPAGTTMPYATEEEAADWRGNYDTNDEQRVSAADAAALAAALETAVTADDYAIQLCTLDERLFHSREEPPPAVIPGKWQLPERQRLTQSDFEEFREHLRDFAAFCREGSFRIG
jgi:hypothetical protein